MPRRNRCSRPALKPIAQLRPEQLEDLVAFANEHVHVHEEALLTVVGDAGGLMTVSESPCGTLRLLSMGAALDPAAIQLTGRKLSDQALRLAV